MSRTTTQQHTTASKSRSSRATGAVACSVLIVVCANCGAAWRSHSAGMSAQSMWAGDRQIWDGPWHVASAIDEWLPIVAHWHGCMVAAWTGGQWSAVSVAAQGGLCF